MSCGNAECPFFSLHSSSGPLAAAEFQCMVDDATQKVAFEQGEILFTQGQTSANLYSLTSGMVKICSISADGREQIVGLSSPGNLLLGLQSISENTYAYTAVAATTVHGCKINHKTLLSLAQTKGDIAIKLVHSVNAQLAQTRALMEVMGQKCAAAKIAAFLLLMTPNSQHDNCHCDLPISRREMAGLFGLSEETVCRLMARMKRTGAIYAPRGKIEIRDRAQLHAIAYSPPDERLLA
jgi:CRP/FNR family transcriptional regulator